LKSVIIDIVSIAALALVIFFGLQYTVQRYEVDGPSMLTNFHDKQQLLINKTVYYLHEPERGDVVIFHRADDGVHEDIYIKRVIGLPGESVEITDGVVYIHKGDGTVIELDEPYITRPAKEDYKGKTIPDNEYFLMGDNRINSSDSRNGWTLPRENIIGKVWISLSLDSFGLVENFAYAGD
jgi:signal peptidase I